MAEERTGNRAEKSEVKGFRKFLLIWAGQLVSWTGSGLTAFALGVWVYQSTGSVTRYALISLVTVLPGILLAPLAGALVDRWDRRLTMVGADCGAALVTSLVALLAWSDRLEIWHLYLLLGTGSLFQALQFPAFNASVTLLVPKRQLGRASGLGQVAQSIAAIGAPIMAGVLVERIALWGVMAIDLASFLVAVATLLLVRIPNPAPPPAATDGEPGGERGSLLQDAAVGWHFVRERPGLFGLLIFFAGSNFALSMVMVLITPLVLSFSSPTVLGVVSSVAGCGLLAGSLVMSVWGGPRRRMRAIFFFAIFDCLILLLGGVRPNPVLIAAASFAFLFGNPIILGCSQAIWQTKVPPHLQGRVFAIRRMVAWSTRPLAYLLAGLLSDRVFEPLLAPGGLLAGSVGRVIGTGPGRGLGFLFIVMGLLLVCFTVGAYHYRPLRLLEEEIPDVIEDS